MKSITTPGKKIGIIAIILLFSLLLQEPVWAQANGTPNLPSKREVGTATGIWMGAYTKYQIGSRLFYYGEYHIRRREWFEEMAQIYLRFGLSYIVNKQFEVTGGVVTPFYWAPNQGAENVDNVVPQYRLWQQLLFINSFPRAKLYHQIRTEQRWKRDYEVGSEFKLTYRFRYKISTYIPLNKPHLEENTLFFSGYNEIFIQAGKPIVYDYLEDNRVFLGLGYILNSSIQFQAGYMWTYRQLETGYQQQNRHIFRFSVYHNLDLRRDKSKGLQTE